MRKNIVTSPFDRLRKPPKQNLLFVPFIWLYSWIMTRGGRLKIYKERMNALKPPFLVLGTHHAFMDFLITPLALMPYRANYVSELEGFEAYGEWIYRQAGCLGTRKFVNDIALIKNIKCVIERKGILVLYPEARYANAGTSSDLPESVGKLAKYLDVPLVTINMRGNYLQSPIWNLKKRRVAPLETTVTQLFTREELRAASVSEINASISRALSYDEYAWQFANNIRIDEPFRAEGLELVLYKCPLCKEEFLMRSRGCELFCEGCGEKWTMTELGRLEGGAGNPFPHIPDWYEWQREQVHFEVDRGLYSLDMKVRIESLPNAINFIGLGEGGLIHTKGGFTLKLCDYGEKETKTLRFAANHCLSVHTEYNYRGKGQCITLSSLDNTYFIFPSEPGFNVTKIQFAAEYMYKLAKAK